MGVLIPSFCLTLAIPILHASQNPETSQLPRPKIQNHTQQHYSEPPGILNSDHVQPVSQDEQARCYQFTESSHKLIRTKGAKIRNTHFTGGGRQSTNISVCIELSWWGHRRGLFKVKIIAVLPGPQQLSSGVVVMFIQKTQWKITYQHVKGLIV